MTDYAKLLYGQALYAQQDNAPNPDELYVDLLRYLPPYWHPITEMTALQKSLGCEAGLLRCQIDNLKRQLYLDTATWGLALWEADYGISTDTEKSNAFRRERIRAKMRGSGTTTRQLLVNVASAFAGGEAEIIEHPAEYRFTVKFVGVKGVPGNMSDLSASIEEIKPAHLAYDYEYTYNCWIAVSDRTWESCAILTWDQLRCVYTYIRNRWDGLEERSWDNIKVRTWNQLRTD